jgi:hypothetical protein
MHDCQFRVRLTTQLPLMVPQLTAVLLVLLFLLLAYYSMAAY